jgi:hypothetical protein
MSKLKLVCEELDSTLEKFFAALDALYLERAKMEQLLKGGHLLLAKVTKKPPSLDFISVVV